MNNVPFKFKDLLFYVSKEWLAYDKKKYRSVFDRSEVNYIFIELSLHNKLFDQSEWELHCEVKAYEQSSGTHICTIEVTRTVSSDEPIAYIREGWGMEPSGTFWKKGVYKWEAWVNNELVVQKQIYILDGGPVNDEQNAYLDVSTLKLYEADYTDRPADSRTYYRTFERNETRYVWAELVAKNLLYQKEAWHCELYFNFYTSTGALKGHIYELIHVQPEDELIQCTEGWGSEEVGTWYEDVYRLEIVFMDSLLAVYPFNVGNHFEESDGTEHYAPMRSRTPVSYLEYDETLSLEELVGRLDALIGLTEIKEKIRDYVTYLQFIHLRREKGIEDSNAVRLHSVFIGNPGTGKTTVANMLGRIYRKLGFLSKGTVLKVDRADLIGEYIGQTAPKVKEAIKKARGGVLFIDEAYALARKSEDAKDFGREAIEILIREMSDGAGDLVVIAAGYPEEMKYFLESNPGIKSRFSHVFEFPDFSPAELLEIAHYQAENFTITLSPEAKNRLYQKFVEAFRTRDRSFGNARFVYHLLEKSKINLGLRVMALPDPASLTVEELSFVAESDVEKAFRLKNKRTVRLPIDEELLAQSLNELNALTGLTQIKKEIEELTELSRYYVLNGSTLVDNFSLHSVFVGNPGTGKTTVARILANIFKALAILERGHLIECDRQALIAGYMGQTAEKTNQTIESAVGGLLFIDEAYNLVNNENDSYGKESIAVLLKRMEDRRGELAVVVAGYPDMMNNFLKANPGMNSRFDRTLYFEDYSAAELYQIACGMFAQKETQIDEAADKFLLDLFRQISLRRDKFFGNARTSRKVVEIAQRRRYLRLAQTNEPTSEDNLLLLGDVIDIRIENLQERKNVAGLV